MLASFEMHRCERFTRTRAKQTRLNNYPAVRTGSSNTRFFFCRGHLPQTSARSKQYLPVILVRLALFRQNFHESWCRKLLAI